MAIQHLDDIQLTGSLTLTSASGVIEMNKQAIQNAIMQPLGTPPLSPSVGQYYYDTAIDKIGVFDNGVWNYFNKELLTGNTNSINLAYVLASNTLTADARLVPAGGIEAVTGGLQLTDTGVLANTYTKVQVDTKGRVLSGSSILAADLPSHTHVNKDDIPSFDAWVRLNTLNQMAAPTAPLSMGTQRITNLVDPLDPQDAATKNYVDSSLVGLRWKVAVRVATTANITLSGVSTAIDTVTIVAGDRVLVKNQSTGTQNGIYIADSGPWSRAEDSNAMSELISAAVYVTSGQVNGGSAWTCTNNASDVLGTAVINWSIFAGAQVVTASKGIKKDASDFQLDLNASAHYGLMLSGNEVRAKVDTTKGVEILTSGIAAKVDGSTVTFDGSGRLTIATAYQTRKYVTTIQGTGAALNFTVTHNLGTEDVTVEVVDVTGKFTVFTNVTRVNGNQLTIGFGKAPVNLKQYKVIVVG